MISRAFRVICVVCLSIMAAGCAHSVHEVHASDFNPYSPLERGEMVNAKSEQFVILGFTGNTDYVDQAYQSLLAACPMGTLSGITTEYSTSLGFFSWTNKILMQGHCVPARRTSSMR